MTGRYWGYRLQARDGSDVNIASTPSDDETFIREGEKGYNMLHINTLYDLLNHACCDFMIHGKKKLHERQAQISLVDRYHESAPGIFIAERTYESFNVYAHMILKKQKFILRIKDFTSNGMLSSYYLPDHAFDDYIESALTKRHTKETKSNPGIDTILPSSTVFDFLDKSSYFSIRFCIVRFQLEYASYTCVATNLAEVKMR